MDDGKEYLAESRLEALDEREGFPTVHDLMLRLNTLPSDSGLHRKVVEAMTTNETSFFRDLHPFELLRNQIIPELVAARARER